MSKAANILLFFGCLLLMSTVSGQAYHYEENVILIPDRDVYFAGSELKLTIFVTEGKQNLPQALSKVVAIEIIDHAGQPLIQQRFGIDHSHGSGIMHLPSSLPTGHYVLRAYTNWMRNDGPESYFHSLITIINPLVASQKLLKSEQNVQHREFVQQRVQVPKLDFSMRLHKKQYSKRDTVVLSYKTEKGSLLSVSAYLPAGTGEAVSWKLPQPEQFEMEDKKLEFLPEVRGQIISGLLIKGDHDNANESMRSEGIEESNGSEIYMAMLGRNSDVQIVEVRDNGSFFIAPGSEMQSGNLVFLKNSRNKLSILIHPDFSKEYAPVEIPEFDPETIEKERIEKLMISHQIQAFYQSGSEEKESDQVIKFYGEADQSIQLTDYINLPVMEEFFRELLKQTIFTRENGQLKLNILSKYTNRIIGPNPLYLVDGIPIFDTKTILDLDPEHIKSIHTRAHKYVYGNIVSDGIVDIESIRGDGSVLDLTEGTATYSYQPPVLVSAKEIDECNFPMLDQNSPDMRSVICWQPQIIVTQDGQGELRFLSSDLRGEFLIVVNILTPDGTQARFQQKLIID